MRAGPSIAVAVVVTCITCAAPARAAVTVGQTFPPSAINCTAPRTILQDTLGGVGDPADYTIRSPGVITSWRYQAPATSVPQLKLKIGRPLGGHAYRIIGDSALQAPVANQLNTFPARIPVQPGDVLGVFVGVTGYCEGSPAPGYEFQIAMDEAFVGEAVVFAPLSDHRLDVSASLEPDCDNDGLGDESQDPDTAACSSAAGPDTTITKRPKDRTKKKRATFEFIASLPGASFECSLDGGAFAPCSSPHEVTVKKGRHSIAVRALVSAQSDPTPATDDWKVKRRRKR